MVGNISANASISQRTGSEMILVQILVSIFLCINMLLILTFFSRAYFYTNMRYILFATALLSDCLILIVTNILVLLSSLKIPIELPVCLILLSLSTLYAFVTPVTLTAMTLERYVAICMPLHHAQLCSQHRALWCIFLIHCISFVPCVLILLSIVTLATESFFQRLHICNIQQLTTQTLQSDFRLGINLIYFAIMCMVILFCYAKIMKVANAALGDSKKSSSRGLRTVTLHGFQLLLCLTQMWRPFIEVTVFKIKPEAFIAVRFSNYILFYLFPRCLSPLIYGLRDDEFLIALKYNALCKFCRNKSLDLTK